MNRPAQHQTPEDVLSLAGALVDVVRGRGSEGTQRTSRALRAAAHRYAAAKTEMNEAALLGAAVAFAEELTAAGCPMSSPEIDDHYRGRRR